MSHFSVLVVGDDYEAQLSSSPSRVRSPSRRRRSPRSLRSRSVRNRCLRSAVRRFPG